VKYEDMPADTLESLYKLYRAVCERDKVAATLSDFHVWLQDEGYIGND